MGRKTFLLLFCFVAISLQADGCLISPYLSDYFLLSKADQKAFIYYDGRDETLILSLDYAGKAKDLAWLIPTPTQPKVSKAPKDFFQNLGKLLSLYKINTGLIPGFSTGYGGLPTGKSEKVIVIERKQVGIFQIAILSANDPEALYKWCKQAGYNLPSSTPFIVKPYIDYKWFFIAVKIEKSSLSGEETIEASIHPLKIEFETSQIVYPLRISYLNRLSIGAKVEKIDAWWGSVAEFGREGKEITSAIEKGIWNDISEGKSFEQSILKKLGFDELADYYNNALAGKGSINDFLPLTKKLEEGIEELAKKEINNLEIVVLADFFVRIADYTPQKLASYLKVSPIAPIEKGVVEEYLKDENGEPIIKQEKKVLCLTEINGDVPYAAYTGDLYLTEDKKAIVIDVIRKKFGK
jgi:hypothetical protein